MRPAFRRVTAPWLALALLTSTSFPTKTCAQPGSRRLDLGVGLTSTYDSNLLQYSVAQLDLFETGTRPDRYSIDSRDDLIWIPELALGFEVDAGHGRRHLVRVRGEGDFHQHDHTADFRSASVTWRESFARHRRFTVSGYVLPRYYLRQLSDEDAALPFPGLSRYRRAQFDLTIASGTWSQRVRRDVDAEFGYQLEHRRYGPGFTDRTSDTHQGELGLAASPGRSSLAARVRFRRSLARGDDGDEMAGVPDDPDVGYHGFGAGVSGRLEFVRRGALRIAGDLAVETEARDYDSSRPRDTFHRGRRDRRGTIEAGVRLGALRRGSARVFWRYENNAAKLGGPTPPATTDAGSYRQQQVGLALDFSTTLWRSRMVGAGGEE